MVGVSSEYARWYFLEGNSGPQQMGEIVWMIGWMMMMIIIIGLIFIIFIIIMPIIFIIIIMSINFITTIYQVCGVKEKIVCVGDINRMCSQEGRGGGTLCTRDDALWHAFNKTITVIEDCWAYDPCNGSSTKCYWCPSN